MKKLLFLALALTALATPASAAAHPLGNFTVNSYSRIEPAGDRIHVLYVLDMAEIPAFRERQRIGDRRAYARTLAIRIGRGLALAVDGRRLALRPVRQVLGFPPGVAGLRTLRLEAVYVAKAPPAATGQHRLAYRDANYASRLGWREIVVRPAAGTRLGSSSAPRETVSDELRAYPKDLLLSPLDVTRATASYVPGPPSAAPALSTDAALRERVTVRAASDGGFASLIAEDDLSVGFVILSLLVALFWGAAHAFSPGHGKAIIAGYLIGTRGTPRHAVLLGLIVTVTHTIGVFALGLVTLALSEFVLPEQLYPWLNLVAALLVVGVGVSVLRWRFREWRHAYAHAHAREHHHRDRGHDHHHHHPQPGAGLRSLLGAGISGGIIPCPTALVVLLAAISLHRVGYGLVLIVAFSFGLAAAVTAIGLIAVSAKRLFSRTTFEGPLVRALPAVSAVVVLALGVVMTARALPRLV